MCQRVQTMCCAVLPSSRIKTSSPSPKAVFPKRQTISYIFSEGTQHREGKAGSTHCSCGVNSSCAPEHFVEGETWARGPMAAEKSLVWQCCWLTGECVGGWYFCISNRNMLRLKIIRDVCGKYEIKGRKQEQSDMVKIFKLSLRFSKDGGSCQMYSNRVPYVQHWWEFAIETRWKKGKGLTASQSLSMVLQTLQRKKMIFFFYINILNSIQI